MIVFFPINTDAPIYHWPFATVAMIVVNVLVFLATLSDPKLTDSLALHYGVFDPPTWITSAFVHGSVTHLLSNMVFLWTFGLIVEGKLGWWNTLLVILGITVAQCAVEQTLMLGSHTGRSYGASAIVFGFMAMSLVWAPENRVQCIMAWWLISMHHEEFDIMVRHLVGVFLTIELIVVALTGLAMSSEILHLMGAAAGGTIAVWMLKRKMVDCENWDWFSVRAGRHTMTPKELADDARRKNSLEAEERRQRQTASSLHQIREIIAQGQPLLAWKAHERITRELPGWVLPEAELAGLIESFQSKGLRVESIPAMAEYLTRFPLRATSIRLQLARILVADQRRPAQALKVLKKIPESSLDPCQREQFAETRALAERLHAADPYEIADDDF